MAEYSRMLVITAVLTLFTRCGLRGFVQDFRMPTRLLGRQGVNALCPRDDWRALAGLEPALPRGTPLTLPAELRAHEGGGCAALVILPVRPLSRPAAVRRAVLVGLTRCP
ncbi:hypothetical protein SDC9_112088 [bioreactor metagenome]|uniref:Uncharacterized protein n=1 Tax=bioreactor metagenome TaxID=1076179 RepID=A0A645BII4_9ZZZZ